MIGSSAAAGGRDCSGCEQPGNSDSEPGFFPESIESLRRHVPDGLEAPELDERKRQLAGGETVPLGRVATEESGTDPMPEASSSAHKTYRPLSDRPVALASGQALVSKFVTFRAVMRRPVLKSPG